MSLKSQTHHRKDLQSLRLTSEQSFQKEALHQHWFLKMYADDPGFVSNIETKINCVFV